MSTNILNKLHSLVLIVFITSLHTSPHHHHHRCTEERVPHESLQGFFHCPAFSAPLPAELPAFSIPPVKPCSPSPTALVPVVLLIVSPTPRPAVPTIPPAVFVMPPTALPSCEVFVSDGRCMCVRLLYVGAYHRGAGFGDALGALVVVGVERHGGCLRMLCWCFGCVVLRGFDVRL